MSKMVERIFISGAEKLTRIGAAIVIDDDFEDRSLRRKEVGEKIIMTCYDGCSTHKSHLAKTCFDFGDYYQFCPTYQRVTGGLK